jgi:ketosteroid isomerase-like protein
MMSAEFVERLRSGYEEFRTGGIEAILDRVAPDLELRDRESAPDRETLVGGEGMEQLYRLNSEVFDFIELDPLDYVDLGDTILVVLAQRVHGRSSGIAIETEVVHAWTFEGGRAVRMQIYPDRERAEQALARSGP